VSEDHVPELGAMRRSYDPGTLTPEDLAPTWHEQLQRWLAEAVAAGVAEPNAMVVATAAPEAEPSARTVLLKGLDERGLVFYTNARSRKGREIAQNPHVALVFPWYPMHRQVIVDGVVEAIPAEESDAYFASRPRGSQLGAVSSPQSSVIASREELDQAYAEAERAYPGEVPRPDGWGGLRVIPTMVEFWQGRPDRLHDRLRFRHTVGEWEVERLAP
jgi:pyridoxamine 5'-phosphate oxidase